MIQLNLLPDVKKEFLKAQKTKALVISTSIIVTLSAVGVTILLFLYVTFGQQLQITLITNDIRSKTEELNNVQDLSKYLTIQNQLKALPELHAQKGSYARLFAILPILNPGPPNNVRLTALQVLDSDKSMLFTGTTATFESLNVFVDTLKAAEATYKEPDNDQATRSKIFDEVVVQSSGLARVNNVSTVSFTIRVTYGEAVFDVRNSDFAGRVPNIETTPSVTGSPQVFNNQPESGDQ